jgi:hypothetical protein
MFFQTMKVQRQLGYQILKIGAFPLESRDLLARGIAGGVAAQMLFACLRELFGPRVKVVGFDAFTTTQLIDCDLTTEALQDYMYLLFCSVLSASR